MGSELTRESIEQQVVEARYYADLKGQQGMYETEDRLVALCDTVETLLRALQQRTRFTGAVCPCGACEDKVNEWLAAAQCREDAHGEGKA